MKAHRRGEKHEELGAVGVWPSVRHGEQAALGVPEAQAWFLIGERAPIDGLAAGTIASCEVSALCHKPGDHAVERGAQKMERLAKAATPTLASAQCSEVFRSTRHSIAVQLKHHAPCGHTTNGNVHEDTRTRGRRSRSGTPGHCCALRARTGAIRTRPFRHPLEE